MTGEPDPDDDPVPDAWEVTYDLGAGCTYPELATEAGSGTVSITVDGETFTAEASGTPDIWDEELGQQTSQYSFHQTTSGPNSITVPLILDGENPTFTISAGGTGDVSGDMECWVELTRRAPKKGVEGIAFTFPRESAPALTGRPITGRGNWSGVNRTQYQIRRGWRGPETEGQGTDGWVDQGPLYRTGNGDVQPFSMAPVTPMSHGQLYYLSAALWRRNPASGEYDQYVAHDRRGFVGSSAGGDGT
jgi:hypothetical protein